MITFVCPVQEINDANALSVRLASPRFVSTRIPIRVPKYRVRLAACVNLHWDLESLVAATGFDSFIDDWLKFHLLAGVEEIVVYVSDNSFARAAPGFSGHPQVVSVDNFLTGPEESAPIRSFAEAAKAIHPRIFNAQSLSHCVARLKGVAKWVVLVPGFDVYLSSPFHLQASKVDRWGWLEKLMVSLDRGEGEKIASLLVADVEFGRGESAASSGPRPSLFSTYQQRGEPHIRKPLLNILNPENVLEVGTSHFVVPRPGAHLLRMDPEVLRANHYIDAATPGMPSRCENCVIFDGSLAALDEELAAIDDSSL